MPPSPAASGWPGIPRGRPAPRRPWSSGWPSLVDLGAEQASVAVQVQPPARIAVDALGEGLPARTVAVQMPVFEVDARALAGLRGEADFDFAGLGPIGLHLPGGTDIPGEG